MIYRKASSIFGVWIILANPIVLCAQESLLDESVEYIRENLGSDDTIVRASLGRFTSADSLIKYIEDFSDQTNVLDSNFKDNMLRTFNFKARELKEIFKRLSEIRQLNFDDDEIAKRDQIIEILLYHGVKRYIEHCLSRRLSVLDYALKTLIQTKYKTSNESVDAVLQANIEIISATRTEMKILYDFLSTFRLFLAKVTTQ